MFLTALLLAALSLLASAASPGAELQVNQRGLNAFAVAGIQLLNGKVPGTRIPDFSGKAKGIHYSFWDISVESFHIDDQHSSVSLSPPGSAHFNVVGISLKVKAHYRLKYHHIISVSGKADATTSGAHFYQTLALSSASGHPHMISAACDSNLGDLKINLHGWAHVVQEILKIFGLHIGVHLKLCPKVEEVIANEGNAYLAAVPLQFDMKGAMKGFHLSYALTSNPSATNSFIGIPFLGKFWFDGHDKDAKIPGPSGVSLTTSGNDMICMNLDADEVLGSAAYAFRVSPLSSYEFGEDFLSKLPSPVRDFFRCECASHLCIGDLVPSVKEHCKPDGRVELRARTSVIATFSFSAMGALTNAQLFLDFFAELPDSTRVQVFVIEAEVGVLIGSSLRIEQWTLKGDSKLTTSSLSLNSTIVGPISSDILQKMWDIALRAVVEGGLNGMLSNGIPLPSLPKAVPVKPRFAFGSHTLFFCTDVQPQL